MTLTSLSPNEEAPGQSSSSAIDTSAIATVAEETCAKCGSTEPWGSGSWCPTCGYYPAVNKCIDGDMSTTQPDEEFNLMKAIPAWAWVLVIGMLGILSLSIVARFVLPSKGGIRLLWTIMQFLVGIAIFGVAHVTAFLYATVRVASLTPFDFIMKPIEVWKPTIATLPNNARKVWLLGWGLTATFCALVVIGGIRYSAIFDDWGFEERGSVNLVQAIVSEARKEREGADNLEDAMNDFVGDAVPEEEEEIAEIFLPTIDCLIFGYTKNSKNGLESILIATVDQNKLKYVAQIFSSEIAEETREELMKRMPTLHREKPFVKCRMNATWLQPSLMCRVAYEDWTNSRRLNNPHFKKLLADVE